MQEAKTHGDWASLGEEWPCRSETPRRPTTPLPSSHLFVSAYVGPVVRAFPEDEGASQPAGLTIAGSAALRVIVTHSNGVGENWYQHRHAPCGHFIVSLFGFLAHFGVFSF